MQSNRLCSPARSLWATSPPSSSCVWARPSSSSSLATPPLSGSPSLSVRYPHKTNALQNQRLTRCVNRLQHARQDHGPPFLRKQRKPLPRSKKITNTMPGEGAIMALEGNFKSPEKQSCVDASCGGNTNADVMRPNRLNWALLAVNSSDAQPWPSSMRVTQIFCPPTLHKRIDGDRPRGVERWIVAHA